jgi:hypothetical protein
MQQADHAIEYDLDAVIVYLVALTIPKWRMFKLVK